MAGDVLSIPDALVGNVELLIGILQALGIFVIIYIIFNVVNTIINRKKKTEMKKMNENLEEIKKLLTSINRKSKI